jgi:hypothetical protein
VFTTSKKILSEHNSPAVSEPATNKPIIAEKQLEPNHESFRQSRKTAAFGSNDLQAKRTTKPKRSQLEKQKRLQCIDCGSSSQKKLEKVVCITCADIIRRRLGNEILRLKLEVMNRETERNFLIAALENIERKAKNPGAKLMGSGSTMVN